MKQFNRGCCQSQHYSSENFPFSHFLLRFILLPMTTDSFKQIKLILWVILFLNLAVAVAKVLAGFIIKSVSMVADGFHSLADGSSNVIGLVGINIASQPPDKGHPYGHKKYETFSAVGIAILLFITCVEVFRQAITKFVHPSPPKVAPFAFAVLIVTLTINISVSFYELRRGRQLKSDILIADSYHTRSDILVTLSVIGSLIAVKIGLPQADPVIALAIAVAIGKAGIDIIRSTSKVLVDESVIEEEKIRNIVESIPNVSSCHSIRSRGRKDSIHVDLHVEVKKEMTTEESHAVADKVEREVKEEVEGISDVIIHIEPV